MLIIIIIIIIIIYLFIYLFIYLTNLALQWSAMNS